MEFPYLRRQSVWQAEVPHRRTTLLPPRHQPTPQDSTPADTLQEVLSDLEQINFARSPPNPKAVSSTSTPTQQHSHASSDETPSLQPKEPAHPHPLKRDQSPRSLIFSPLVFSKNKREEMSVKVYYFNLPTCKAFRYDATTTIAGLIGQALQAYLIDPRLDHSKIKSKHPGNYELRMLLDQNKYMADMSIEAIAPDRHLSDNIFEALVLLPTPPKKERKFSYKQDHAELFRSSTQKLAATTLIHVLNQVGQQLGVLNMQRNDSIERIFQYVESNDYHNMRSYYLSERQHDDNPLPRDFEVRNLESSTVFIKAKKYIDDTESDHKQRQPIRSLTIFQANRPEEPPLPIGIQEASEYQEWAVIKVNKMGFQQERILGIDQNKIYNYDPELRASRKRASFFSQIFGADQTTGTKRPYRLVSDIQEVRGCSRGFVLVFPQKAIQYIVAGEQQRDRILRKIRFLVNLAREQKRSMQRMSQASPSP